MYFTLAFYVFLSSSGYIIFKSGHKLLCMIIVKLNHHDKSTKNLTVAVSDTGFLKLKVEKLTKLLN